MDSQIKTIELIDTIMVDIDEVIIIPTFAMTMYIILVHVAFYNYIDYIIIDLISMTIFFLIVESYYVEIQNVLHSLIY